MGAAVQAGQLAERVTFQQKGVTKNAIGEEVVTWSDVATVWADVRPVRGGEFYAANQMQQTLDLRIFIRARSGITHDLRLVWRGTPYDITGVIPGTAKYEGLIEVTAINGVRNGR